MRCATLLLFVLSLGSAIRCQCADECGCNPLCYCKVKPKCVPTCTCDPDAINHRKGVILLSPRYDELGDAVELLFEPAAFPTAFVTRQDGDVLLYLDEADPTRVVGVKLFRVGKLIPGRTPRVPVCCN